MKIVGLREFAVRNLSAVFDPTKRKKRMLRMTERRKVKLLKDVCARQKRG